MRRGHEYRAFQYRAYGGDAMISQRRFSRQVKSIITWRKRARPLASLSLLATYRIRSCFLDGSIHEQNYIITERDATNISVRRRRCPHQVSRQAVLWPRRSTAVSASATRAVHDRPKLPRFRRPVLWSSARSIEKKSAVGDERRKVSSPGARAAARLDNGSRFVCRSF